MTDEVNELNLAPGARVGIAQELGRWDWGDAGVGEGGDLKVEDRKECRSGKGRQIYLGA